MNADNKLLETVFVIAICCLSDYKQQYYLQYLTTFVDSINVSDCRLSSVFLIYWRRSQNNLIQGLGVISCFCEKIILFRCMFHDDKMDILIKLIGTACAWKEDIWQYNILFCILTVGKHGTVRGSRNDHQGGEGPGQSDKKALTTIFLVLSLFYRSQMVNFKEIYRFSRLQIGSNFFQGVQLFPGGVQLLIPYRNPFNLWFSRGGPDHLLPPSGPALGTALTASWLRLQYIISFGLGKR